MDIEKVSCGDCKYWSIYEEVVSQDIGTCYHPKITDMISVGYSDEFDFDKHFGCILFEAR